jgi:hypothetical protein
MRSPERKTTVPQLGHSKNAWFPIPRDSGSLIFISFSHIGQSTSGPQPGPLKIKKPRRTDTRQSGSVGPTCGAVKPPDIQLLSLRRDRGLAFVNIIGVIL